MSKNEITGDEIKTKVSSKEYEENFDKIFRKEKTSVGYPPLTTNKPVESSDKDDWDEERIDIIGSNGNTAEHYKPSLDDIYQKIERDYNEGN